MFSRALPRRSRSWAGFLLGAGLATLGIAIVGVAAPAQAEPSPQQVEKQIDKQWNEIEPVIEQYNHTHEQLTDSRAQQRKLAAQLKPLQTRVDAALSDVDVLAGRAYIQGGVEGLSSMLISGSPNDLTDKLTYLNEIASGQRTQVSQVIDLRDKLAADKQQLDTVTATLTARDADLSAKKRAIQKKIDELQKLRIQAYGAAGGATGQFRTGPCPAEYTNDAGGKAAAMACSLIGKPYVWAAAGPDGYDCSGLTLAAWKAAGVSLRHYTQWQWADTKPVSRADLRPGDLVFWFADLHHMGIYVGDDTIVNATHTGDYVRMDGINDIGPIAGFRRPA